MKKRVLMGSLMVLLMFCAVTNAADNHDLKVVNNTGYPIKYISISLLEDQAWGENEISAVLDNKDNFEMTFEGAKKGCSWNMKVMWADNNAATVFKGIDLCKAKVLTLKYDRKTDAATFSTE